MTTLRIVAFLWWAALMVALLLPALLFSWLCVKCAGAAAAVARELGWVSARS